jgi:hypothetical protein
MKCTPLPPLPYQITAPKALVAEEISTDELRWEDVDDFSGTSKRSMDYNS